MVGMIGTTANLGVNDSLSGHLLPGLILRRSPIVAWGILRYNDFENLSKLVSELKHYVCK